mgnify:CR=1 FL=1
MSTIIRTRSPFFIRTPQETNSSLSYFQINITVFGGLSSSTEVCDDLYATYALQKKPLGSEDSITVDISEIVNDHIEQVFTGTYSASSAKSSIWVTVATSPRQSDGTLIGSTITSNTYLAQEGYNKFKEGVNYTTEPTAMISSNYIQYHLGSTVTIPVNVERVTSIQWRSGTGVRETDSFTDNGNQNQKIQYAQFTSTTLLDNVLVTYDSGSTSTITLAPTEECKYPVNKITFVNRWGAMQDLFFFKKSVDSLESRSESFNRSIFEARAVHLDPPEEEGQACQESLTFNTYSTTAHAKKTFNANATESVLLNSGFVNELMNPFFEELMVSEYIWLTDSSANIYPVNLKESSFTKKTGLNDRLINYTMNFEKSFDLVNNIR